MNVLMIYWWKFNKHLWEALNSLAEILSIDQSNLSEKVLIVNFN